MKASQALFDDIAAHGGKPLMWKTGHTLIKAKMKETDAPLAGEMSGHIFFKHRWYGFDDALYAAVRLLEAVSQGGQSLTEIMDAMPKSVATPELRFPVDESRKFAIVDEVRDRLSADGAKVDATDGVRVSTDDGWWLLRASNTQDVLVARAEATDEAGLERLVAQIDDQLAKSGVGGSTARRATPSAPEPYREPSAIWTLNELPPTDRYDLDRLVETRVRP